MKRLLLTLFLATLCSTAYGQTIKSLGYNTTNNTIVGLTNTQRLAFEHIALTAGTAGTPSLTYASGTNVFGTFASTAFGVGPFLGFSVDGTRRFYISTNTIFAELPIAFSAGNASATRTNLGASRAPIWAYKATNQTNSTANLVSDAALTFAAAANTKYLVTANLGFEYGGGETMVGKFIIPTNATAHGGWNIYFGALGDYLFYPTEEPVTNEQEFIKNHDANVFIPQQFVVVTGTNGGSVTFQFASTNTNSVISSVGSYLKAEVIE